MVVAEISSSCACVVVFAICVTVPPDCTVSEVSTNVTVPLLVNVAPEPIVKSVNAPNVPALLNAEFVSVRFVVVSNAPE